MASFVRGNLLVLQSSGDREDHPLDRFELNVVTMRFDPIRPRRGVRLVWDMFSRAAFGARRLTISVANSHHQFQIVHNKARLTPVENSSKPQPSQWSFQ